MDGEEQDPAATTDKNFWQGRDNERVQEYRPRQRGREQIERLNVLLYKKVFTNAILLGRRQGRSSNNIPTNHGYTSYPMDKVRQAT